MKVYVICCEDIFALSKQQKFSWDRKRISGIRVSEGGKKLLLFSGDNVLRLTSFPWYNLLNQFIENGQEVWMIKVEGSMQINFKPEVWLLDGRAHCHRRA